MSEGRSWSEALLKAKPLFIANASDQETCVSHSDMPTENYTALDTDDDFYCLYQRSDIVLKP